MMRRHSCVHPTSAIYCSFVCYYYSTSTKRFCSSTGNSFASSHQSPTLSTPAASHIASLMTPSAFVASQITDQTKVSLRNQHHSPTNPESTFDAPSVRIAQSFSKAKEFTPLSETFSRKEGDPSLYHEISPENLRFLFEAEQDEILNSASTSSLSSSSASPPESGERHFQRDVPYFSSASENQSYVDTENIRLSSAQSFLGREGDQSRLAKKREVRDAALHLGLDGGDDGVGVSAMRLFASAKTNAALAAERSLQQMLDSGAAEEHKANVALEFASKFQEENLPIRARLVEELFGLWNRVMQKDLLDKDEELPKNLIEVRRQAMLLEKNVGEGGAKDETGFPSGLEQQQQQQPQPQDHVTTFLQPMLNLYFHTRKHFTAPTAQTIEHLMTTLHVASNNAANPEVMETASRLMLDTDQFTVMATRITYATYFDICALNGKMEIALLRFADAKNNLHLDADAGMVRSIVAGLVRNGLLSEATAFLARTKAVAVDVSYLNSILELLSLSSDPMAAFAAFRSLEHCGIVPNSTSCFHLLRACEASGQWDVGTGFVLAHMQKLKIKGDDTTLNLLLKGLLLSQETSGLKKYANQLYLAMKQKGTIEVFEEVEAALPENIRARGKKLRDAYVKQQKDLEKLSISLLPSSSSSSSPTEGCNDADGDTNRALLRHGSDGKSKEFEDEETLRELAALGKLSPVKRHRHDNSDVYFYKGGAPLSVVCRFCLRKHLGSFEERDAMKKFLDLKWRTRRNHQYNNNMNNNNNNNNNNNHEEQDQHQRRQLQHQIDELERISKLLKPRLWRYVHKSFYGVMPASTQVVDMNLEKRREFIDKMKGRHQRRNRRQERL